MRFPEGAVLSGHVDRLALFASILDNVVEQDSLPGPALRGLYRGVPIVVIGTGMGGPVTVRAVLALARRGARVLVRAGGAGPVQAQVLAGDLVIASAAVRHEGASCAFLDDGEPAVADPATLRALVEVCDERGLAPRVGVFHSKDSFYGEIDPAASPQADRLGSLWRAWQGLGVLASEMEAAALFSAASSLGIRAGAVVRVNDVHSDSGAATGAQAQLCEVACAAVVRAMQATADA